MNFKGEKILVTGASGFIGSFIVERLLELGAEVWAGVRQSSSREYLQDSRIKFLELDFSDKGTLSDQLKSHGPWHHVIHAAGATKCKNAADFFTINTDGTRHFAEALIETQTIKGRFIYFSSLSVFGPVRQEPTGNGKFHYAKITESDTPMPNSAYGQSKLRAEAALEAIKDLDYVILRPTGVYGPREKDYFLMAKSIRQHIDFSVGFKPQEITFIFVRDLVDAACLALSNGPSRRAYFLTDGEVYDSRAFSNLLQAEMGVRCVLHIKAPLWLLHGVCKISGALAKWRGKATTLNMDKYHILRQRNWQCNIRPAQELLGYVPKYKLEDGVKESVAWYKKAGWL